MEPKTAVCKEARKPLRLAVLTTTYPSDDDDAIPAFVFELCRRLSPAFEITVLAPACEGARAGHWAGVHVVRYRYASRRGQQLTSGGGILPNLRRSPALLVWLPGLMLSQAFALWTRRRQFDVIHAHWLVPNGVIALLSGGGRPVVCTSHGADVFALQGRLFETLRRWVMQNAFAVTAVGEPLRAALTATAPSKAVSVLPMGCDLERFSPRAEGSPLAGRLLYVGRLVPKKGVDALLRALALLQRSHRRVHLRVIGEGPERETLEQLTQSLGLGGDVQFLGGMANARLPDEYREAETVVLPFRQAADGDAEGLGLTLIEALACGCKLVVGYSEAQEDLTRDCPGLWRCDADDSSALAEAIEASLRTPHQAQSLRAARQPRLLPMAWETIAAQYADLLLAAHRSASKPGDAR
ncbi:MAG: glycosyltransferase [Pseudomonadota bacterium]